MARAIVYIDGFNLYKGQLEDTPYRWLNLDTLCRQLLPGLQIERIRYFTALVKAFRDPQQPFRQQMYWRALHTLGNLDIIEGFFKVNKRAKIRLSAPLPDGTDVVRTRIANEKGSDVNLATYLIHDAHLGRYDTAVIISNDADYALPVRIVQHELGRDVWLIKPRLHQYSELDEAVNCIVWPPITNNILQACQFPDVMSDATGTFRKPREWDAAYMARVAATSSTE